MVTMAILGVCWGFAPAKAPMMNTITWTWDDLQNTMIVPVEYHCFQPYLHVQLGFVLGYDITLANSAFQAVYSPIFMVSSQLLSGLHLGYTPGK